MIRLHRSQEALRKASDHLHYEIWMLLNVARGLSSAVTAGSILNNALIESFSMHARVVLDFLFAVNPRSDDVIAEDFFEDPSVWHQSRPKKPDNLENIHSRVGKEIAHLTYARQEVSIEAKGWSYIEIAEKMREIFNLFLKKVNPELLGSRWNSDHDRS